MSGAAGLIGIVVACWLLLATPVSLLWRMRKAGGPGESGAKTGEAGTPGRGALDRRTLALKALRYVGALVVVRLVVPAGSPIVMGLWGLALVLATITAVRVAMLWPAASGQASGPAVQAPGTPWHKRFGVRLAGHCIFLVVLAAVIAAPVVFG